MGATNYEKYETYEKSHSEHLVETDGITSEFTILTEVWNISDFTNISKYILLKFM